MYAIIKSTTGKSDRGRQKPELLCHGDFKSLLVPRLCDEVEACLTPDADLYARSQDGGEEEIVPADNTYGLLAALDRGRTHIVVEVPATYGTPQYRVHFAIEEF